MTGTTTPDGIRYPNDYNAPADVPSDMQTMAADVQTALNKKPSSVPTSVSISRASGWGNNFPTANRMGKVVILSGHFQRSATLSVTANSQYTIGTLPAGYRPKVVERMPVMWSDAGVWKAGGLVQLVGDGTIVWVPTVSATLAINDYVSVSGVTFVTP